MSELEYSMKCPNEDCPSNQPNEQGSAIYMFSGSGKGGVCLDCEHELDPEAKYKDFKGHVISYTG